MIVLTDNATEKVRSLMDAEGVADLALRVAVRPGGCSGFSYEMFFDTDVAEDDQTVDYSGVKVVVDPSSAMLLEGGDAPGCDKAVLRAVDPSPVAGTWIR